MCTPSGGWRKHADLYNPGHSPVVLREYMNEESESRLDVRGGRKAGDHVDILGTWDLMVSVFLKILDNVTKDVSFSRPIYYKLYPTKATMSLSVYCLTLNDMLPTFHSLHHHNAVV